MRGTGAAATITVRLADAFYTEALLLADETRGYLDGRGEAERAELTPLARVIFACESLNATTRLMQVIAWLLSCRSGDAALPHGAPQGRTMLADVEPIDPDDMAHLPAEAQRLIAAGIDLYDRVRRLEEGQAPSVPILPTSPALALIQRLERSL